MNSTFSYQEWQRDWPYDAQQPFRLELVLNPAKQSDFVLKDKRGVVPIFVMKPLFSGEVFCFFKPLQGATVGRNARKNKKGSNKHEKEFY
jgi:hypothetical protein